MKKTGSDTRQKSTLPRFHSDKFAVSSMSVKKRINIIWQIIFYCAVSLGMLSLVVLILSIMNNAFGFVALKYEMKAEELFASSVDPDRPTKEEMLGVLEKYLSKGLIRRLDADKPLAERGEPELMEIVNEKVLDPKVIESWPLIDSILRIKEIYSYGKENDFKIVFRSWVTPQFLTSPQSSVPEKAGIRQAFLGSFYIIIIAILTAFPLGVGAAIYLEEYAKNNFLNRIININISNLAGIPSIIYGLLGLAIFVRFLAPVTGGSVFGLTDPATAHGRTILSAGLTMGLLVLPILIINAQEAVRAVPDTLRESSYALGATKWQTISHHVLPEALPRILTGTILAVSRAIGETAPLVVVGASTFIAVDPASVFSRFTALPIQIYQWSARPQAEFRHVSAAAIIVLLLLLLSLNAFAIILRNRINKKRSTF